MGSALVTAFFFWIVGRFKLSNFARFLPFPVIGGFLAGSGIMLIFCSFNVMTGTSLTWSTLPQFMTFDMFLHWGPGVLFALGVFAIMYMKPHFLILPGSLFGVMLLFFMAIACSDQSLEHIRSQGWLLASMPSGSTWPVITPHTMAMVDWPMVLHEIPSILTVALLSLVGILLNINGIELGARQDIDIDQELKVEAVGNFLSSLGGGFAGYASLSMSLLGPKTNTTSRIIPLTTALVCIGVLFFGAQVLTFIPKPLLGGLLFLIGFFFVEEWIISGWKRLTLPDYIILLVIVLTIVAQGFLQGIGLGLGLTILIFMFRFTRIPAIRDEATLATLRSTRERTIPNQILLAREGHACVVLKLTGYLFFGSAYFVGKRIKELLDSDTPPEQIILDLARVKGFDISAVNSFQRIAQQTFARDIAVSFASPPDRLIDLLTRNSSPEVMKQVTIHTDLDESLEWAEKRLIAKHQARLNDPTPEGLKAREEYFHAAVEGLDAHLKEQELFEKIMENIQPYLVQKTVTQGEVLAREGNEQDVLFFILWGSISLFETDKNNKQHRVGSIGPGKFIVPQITGGSWDALHTAQAELQAMVAILSRESIAKMESEAPQSAMLMYKYISQVQTKRQ
jgi:SulP family sulfate permease